MSAVHPKGPKVLPEWSEGLPEGSKGLPVEMCVLGWTGVVPFRRVFIEKTQKNEVFCQGLRMGRVASCRHILMNFHIRNSSRLELILVATTLLAFF